MNRWLAVCLGSFMGFIGFAGDLPAWISDWTFKGDLRLRYEGTDNDVSKDRNRGRFRLRLAGEKAISDKLDFGFRLASGAGEPTSTNQSFDDGFSGKEIWIDRVFVEYKLNNGVIAAGKIANPFETTNILWDSDVNPEGLSQSFGDKTFVHLGQFMVEEQSSKTDSNLLAGQVGRKFDRGLAALGYYHYSDLTDAGLPSAGNNSAASDFHLLDVVGSYVLNTDKKLKATVHFVNNLSEDAPSGVESNDIAYALFLSYGKAKQAGEWDLKYKYAHIEANAVVGAFADSDFGFADREGHQVSGNYQFSKHVTWSLSIAHSEGILSDTSDFLRVQLDCNVKF